MKSNEQYGQYLSTGEVRLIRTLPGPIERIWDYLIDPEKRIRWFAGGALEPRIGGKVSLKFRHIEIAPDEVPPEQFKQYHDPGDTAEGVVTRWEPPRVLAYTFGGPESEVTFELTPEGKNVLLVLTHRSRGEDLAYMVGYSAGWHTHLAQLVAQLEGAPRPPFWPMHVRLREEYSAIRTAAFPSSS